MAQFSIHVLRRDTSVHFNLYVNGVLSGRNVMPIFDFEDFSTLIISIGGTVTYNTIAMPAETTLEKRRSKFQRKLDAQLYKS